MVFGSLLEYAIVGYFGKRISMRKSRSEQQINKKAMIAAQSKSDGDLAQLSTIPNQFHNPIYNHEARNTSLTPFNSQQQLRSPSYLTSSPNAPNMPSVPSILVENTNNEPIYNEHTLHPPSLPSLPSNELNPQYLPPRSHSADNYIYQHSNNDPRRLNQTLKYNNNAIRSANNNTQSNSNKFNYYQLHQNPDYYFNSTHSNLYYPPSLFPSSYFDRRHHQNDLYNDHFTSYPHPTHLSSANLQQQPLDYYSPYHSMSYTNKFGHYPYSIGANFFNTPTYYNSHYQPFYQDYPSNHSKSNFLRQSVSF